MEQAGQRTPPRLENNTAHRFLIAVLIAGGMVAGAILLFLFNPAQSSFYPFCLFYKTTGLLCPGCGGLRATHQLLHGRVLEALHFNALFVLFLPVFIIAAARWGVATLMHKQVRVAVKPWWLWITLAVLSLFAILRNLPFAPFCWLAGK